jgi:hypothetical protein
MNLKRDTISYIYISLKMVELQSHTVTIKELYYFNLNSITYTPDI